MEKKLNLTKILLPYAKKKLWVALTKDYKKVIAAERDLKKTIEEAEKKKKPFVLIQALPDYSGFVPFIGKNEI